MSSEAGGPHQKPMTYGPVGRTAADDDAGAADEDAATSDDERGADDDAPDEPTRDDEGDWTDEGRALLVSTVTDEDDREADAPDDPPASGR